MPRRRDDAALIEAIGRHLKGKPGHGFGLLFGQALHPIGFGMTRSWRVYASMQLNLPRRGKRRLPDRIRELLRIEIDTSLPSARVIRALDELVELRGAPRRIGLDNGPEFTSASLQYWARRQGIELLHIQPGKPTQNAYIERFNRTYLSHRCPGPL